MVNSEHDKTTNFIGLYFNFIGLYFVDEGGSETGRIIAQVSDGYYLVQFDCIQRTHRHPDWKSCPPPILIRAATVVVRDAGYSFRT
jgi:hypothetical protein